MFRVPSLLVLAVALVCISASVAFADPTPSVNPSAPGSTVPTWVFYWVLGIVTAGSAAWAGVTKVLWERGNKKSVLSEEERTWLRELHNMRSEVPKVWTDLFDEIEEALKRGETTLQQLVALVEGDKADLQRQLKERLELHDRQQAKMLKLAVRVQRAVEALAGLQAPEIEEDLDDANGEV